MRQPGHLYISLAGLCVAVVGVIIAWFAWQDPKAPASSHPVSPASSAAPAASAGPTAPARKLQYTQLRVGDCLTGSNMQLNTGNQWPNLVSGVPCRQAHTAEVFYIDLTYWNKDGTYPGDSTIEKDADTGCENAFKSYIGIEPQDSRYQWTSIAPYGNKYWGNGDRALYCIAYYPTSKQPAGSVIYGSLKGADK
jgi:Septum formation